MTNSNITSLTKLTTDINVGMDEVVNVFVAQYEQNLYNKRDELQDKVNICKRKIKDYIEAVEQSVDVTQYVFENSVLGVYSIIQSITADFEGNKNNGSKSAQTPNITVCVHIKGSKSESSYSDTIIKSFQHPISTEDVTKWKEMTEELSLLNKDLMKVMMDIKGIDRKERQIRGKISAQKLEASGFNDLLSNPEMLQLIQLN